MATDPAPVTLRPPASDVARLVLALARMTGNSAAVVRLTHGITPESPEPHGGHRP